MGYKVVVISRPVAGFTMAKMYFAGILATFPIAETVIKTHVAIR